MLGRTDMADGLMTAMLIAVVGLLVAAMGVPAVATARHADIRVTSTCPPHHWVGTWSTSPSSAAGQQPLDDQTARMVVEPHVPGTVVRLRLDNRFGTAPVTLGPVVIGRQAKGAAVVPGSGRPLLFGGAPTVTLPPGEQRASDAVEMDVRAFENLSISLAVPGRVDAPTEHAVTRQTNYLAPPGSGDRTRDEGGARFTQRPSGTSSAGWYFLGGVDVLAPASTGSVVAFGDSLTNGTQQTSAFVVEDTSAIDRNARYPDALARRLDAAGFPLSVLNAGVGGNRVLRDGLTAQFGPSGVARFRADVLQQPGVTTAIVLEGINDIGQTPGITAGEVVGGLQALVAQAHAAGIRILLGTLMPTGGVIVPTYSSPQAAAVRQDVNAWIRSQRVADGVVDFDAAVRDPADPRRLLPAYDGGDHLHLSPAGYQAMADAVDLAALAVPEAHRTVRIRVSRALRPSRIEVAVAGRRVGRFRSRTAQLAIPVRSRSVTVRVVRRGRPSVRRKVALAPCEIAPGRRANAVPGPW